jgi:hypothetical protein
VRVTGWVTDAPVAGVSSAGADGGGVAASTTSVVVHNDVISTINARGARRLLTIGRRTVVALMSRLPADLGSRINGISATGRVAPVAF